MQQLQMEPWRARLNDSARPCQVAHALTHASSRVQANTAENGLAARAATVASSSQDKTLPKDAQPSAPQRSSARLGLTLPQRCHHHRFIVCKTAALRAQQHASAPPGSRLSLTARHPAAKLQIGVCPRSLPLLRRRARMRAARTGRKRARDARRRTPACRAGRSNAQRRVAQYATRGHDAHLPSSSTHGPSSGTASPARYFRPARSHRAAPQTQRAKPPRRSTALRGAHALGMLAPRKTARAALGRVRRAVAHAPLQVGRSQQSTLQDAAKWSAKQLRACYTHRTARGRVVERFGASASI